ncbi:hypothetical protein Avbf_10314 [Armadillidium vulgare]|nr:hypothetical protein Avbf_10314 [Armadillidium vulgare]
MWINIFFEDVDKYFLLRMWINIFSLRMWIPHPQIYGLYLSTSLFLRPCFLMKMVKKNLDAKDSDILDEFFSTRILNFDVDKLGKNLLFEKLQNPYTKFLVTLQDDIKLNKRPKNNLFTE